MNKGDRVRIVDGEWDGKVGTIVGNLAGMWVVRLDNGRKGAFASIELQRI